MPLALVFGAGALLGAGTVYFASDKVGDVLKYGAIAGAVYIAGKHFKAW